MNKYTTKQEAIDFGHRLLELGINFSIFSTLPNDTKFHWYVSYTGWIDGRYFAITFSQWGGGEPETEVHSVTDADLQKLL